MFLFLFMVMMLFPVFITILRITGGFFSGFIFISGSVFFPGSGIFPASVPAAPFFMVPAAVLLCKLLYFADGMLCAPVIGGAGIHLLQLGDGQIFGGA